MASEGPPQDAVGRAVALDLTLSATPKAVVAIPGAEVHITGLLFDLVVLRRATTPADGPFGWLGAHPTVVAASELSWDEAPEEFIRLAIRYGDGRVATNLASVGSWRAAPALLRVGGGGHDLGDRRYRVRYWLSPLPVEAATVEFEWPALDIGATRTTLDGSALAGALQ